MGKVIMSGIVPQLKLPISVEANFTDNTWEQIIAACQANAVPDTWVVGNQKSMTINGTGYAIDIIGKHHDIYADGSGTAPLTFQLHDCYNAYYPMNDSSTNNGGWKESKMRNTHLPLILSSMPHNVKTGIKAVNKLTSVGNSGSSIVTTADTLFLLSEMEVKGSSSMSYEGEGNQYAYYGAGNSPIKKYNGNDNYWWTRSPYKTGGQNFCEITKTGGVGGGSAATQDDAVSFAFCF